MDDLTLQHELEALAGNAWNATPNNDTTTSRPEPISTTSTRWSKLFEISSDDAIDLIISHRNDLTRTRISDEHWDLIRVEKEAEGHDRETYEYELNLQQKKAALPNLVPAAEDSGITYLVELTGPLDSVEQVQRAAGLRAEPEVVYGESAEDGRNVVLACIDGTAKSKLLNWASTDGGGYEPVILVNPKSLR
ncbi:hypothetical protein CLAFUW4_10491 [Fulvia fulva]|uniref:Uncharacterized protein n=1 Tax=Passalora fulva TaxID=5499 RepID=A0A9Q8LFT7_PASFU|nr:uncharacterized protein CLAFUR5_05106 [Fulvia fulva]KAK4615893.1 hypothetical protein CLAFUR4_10494 [Fulvia fulva]KAK4617169.1 hypothetical protein CLAFUR0_10496 [Fulvia fulva]UJO16419.1 hypothetical protein CLAFUR5_05106 [Fulvia fulva]WPV19668.1 hypothetical protein CLAFUW4_10491 [Fulvia fulva]WPV33784.1 hypothetical protein CLAFUW7_10491 [Fulvia fulva]